MSLYTDNDVVTPADMLALDSEVAAVARVAGIPLDGPGGIIRQAWQECADAITSAIQVYGGAIYGAWPGILTIGYDGGFGTSRQRMPLSGIVTSSPYGNRDSQLKRWMTYRALSLLYRDASARKTNDRYQVKFDTYEHESKRVWRALFSSGLPRVFIPFECPGAVHGYGAGVWSTANLSTVVTGSAAAFNALVAITWVDQSSGYVSPVNKGNAESGPSAVLLMAVPASNVLSVSIAGLIPPNNQAQFPRGIADGPVVTKNATGWNVYVGSQADPAGVLYLQNSTTVPIATTSYTLSGSPATTGYQLLPGQVADKNEAFQRVSQRG
jgi:hypothetical protein